MKRSHGATVHIDTSHFHLLLLQHKKLVEGTQYEELSTGSYSENDISNSLKNGILYLEDPIDHVGVPPPLHPPPPLRWTHPHSDRRPADVCPLSPDRHGRRTTSS